MNRPTFLRDVLHRAMAQYLRVSPAGFHLGGAQQKSIVARILKYGEARTLYTNRRPECRSLDGIRSQTHPDRTCASCALQPACTSQLHLELLINGRPYRLLLAYTSAGNFLIYAHSRDFASKPLEHRTHRLIAIDRGHFTEIRFEAAQ